MIRKEGKGEVRRLISLFAILKLKEVMMRGIGKKNKGVFVTFDGPNGSGKSTLLASVARQLTFRGLEVLCTKEPTLSPLGQFVRTGEENYRGRIFACLIAADRYFHLENEILPALRQGKVVLSDRYVESSLALQRLDGLDLDFIWALNEQVYIPDLSIVLTASVEVLEGRLSLRSRLSRFERTKSRKNELKYYLEAAEFLSARGFNVFFLDNGITSLDQNVELTIQEIAILLDL